MTYTQERIDRTPLLTRGDFSASMLVAQKALRLQRNTDDVLSSRPTLRRKYPELVQSVMHDDYHVLFSDFPNQTNDQTVDNDRKTFSLALTCKVNRSIPAHAIELTH